MPAADVDVEELLATVAGASELLRERHPEIEWDGPRERTPEEIERGRELAARLKKSHQVSQEIDSEAESSSPGWAISSRKPK
jgi:hypothetical protein